jgi:hypothetical protein
MACCIHMNDINGNMRQLTVAGHQDTAMGVLERAARSGELEGKPLDVLRDCLRITHSWNITPLNQRVIIPLQETLRFLINSKEIEQGQTKSIEMSEKALGVSEESLRFTKKSYRLNWWIFWFAVLTLIVTLVFGVVSLFRTR